MGFNSSGPAGTVWDIGFPPGRAFNAAATPSFGTATFGSSGANEGLTVFLVRQDSSETVVLQIGERTGNTTCDFFVQALMVG